MKEAANCKFSDLTGVIQAGGQSQRMGRNKALMNFLGDPLILRPIRLLEQVTNEIILVTNNPDEYRFLNKAMVRDVRPGTGALGGLLTALTVASTPIVATVACDMPFPNASIIKKQYDILKSDPTLALVIPESRHGLEPMHVIYRRELCLSAVRAAIERGDRKMISWHGEIRRHILGADEIKEVDPMDLAFINLNTQDEFLQAEDLARKMEEN